MGLQSLLVNPHPIGNVFSDAGLALTTVGTSEEVLKSYTLERDWLAKAKDRLVISAVFTTAASAANKTPRIRFGGLTGTVIAGGVAVALNNGSMLLQAVVQRLTQTTQVANGVSLFSATGSPAHLRSAPTQDLGTDILVSITGQSATLGEIVLREVWADIVRAN